MGVGLLDYGSGNLHSAARALAAAGAFVEVTGDVRVLEACERLVVPGVGAFTACMDALDASGASDFVRDWVGRGRPILGICVGHQVLFGSGNEGPGDRSGIGILDGRVTRLPVQRLPHMGWNSVEAAPGSTLFRGIGDEQFYFVHSYGVLEAPHCAHVTWAEHQGSRFVAAVERDNVASTQFHPEKSGRAGAALLRNWLSHPIG